VSTNILVFIHGITPEERPSSHEALYDAFWAALRKEQPSLARAIVKVCGIEWGNTFPGSANRPDTLLSEAERVAGSRVRYDAVKTHPGPENRLYGGLLGDWGIPGARLILRPIREQLVQFGLADAVYYASQEGEADVRQAVYGQVLGCMRAFKGAPDVRLHLVAHSLGVTVAHDFLYGLFGSSDPDYLHQASSDEDRQDFKLWKDKVGTGKLRLGSFTAMASQLPLFVMRKRELVQQLSRDLPLDPRVIGVGLDARVRWLIVYDIDDVLGFATRELYGNAASIRQVQVDAGDNPIKAHTGYWSNGDTIREAAKLIADCVTD
jgi:hypothetical protein